MLTVLLATHGLQYMEKEQEVSTEPLKSPQTKKRLKERLIVEVTFSLPAAVTGKQTGSWFALITGKWVRPEDDDRITPIACDVIGDVVQC